MASVISFTLLYVLFVVCLPPAEIISVLSAVSERVTVTVVDQRQSSFVVGKVGLYGDRLPEVRCFAGLVRPVAGAVVTYTRLGEDQDILVEITPPRDDPNAVAAELISSEGITTAIRGVVGFDPGAHPVGNDNKKCDAGSDVVRLPIHGRLRVGEEQQPPVSPRALPPSLLHSGTIDVSGKALTDPFGLSRPTIYSVASIRLPVGARVEVPNRHHSNPLSFWWGSVQRTNDGPALQVNAATEAPALVIYRPGAARASEIEVGRLAQLFLDTNVLRLQFVLAALFIFIQVAGILAETLLSPARNEAQRVTVTQERRAEDNGNAPSVVRVVSASSHRSAGIIAPSSAASEGGVRSVDDRPK